MSMLQSGIDAVPGGGRPQRATDDIYSSLIERLDLAVVITDVDGDIVSLNQWPDRRVTPALRAGVTPGTVDVDLNVEDKAPIHASLEVNNRQSPSTTASRVSATVHYRGGSGGLDGLFFVIALAWSLLAIQAHQPTGWRS